MDRLRKIKPLWAWLIYALLDTICVGMGMGVPFFNILFGFVVGCIIAIRIGPDERDTRAILREVLRGGGITAGFTLLLMAVLWERAIAMLFDPVADLANFGIPMILFEPRASFIGWLVLMILISPFLQFLMTVLGSVVVLAGRSREKPTVG